MSLSQPTVKPDPESERLPGKKPGGQPPRRDYLRALFPPPLALALLVFGLAWILGLARGPITLDVGADDNLDLLYLGSGENGFFAPESRPPRPDFPEADQTYRWVGKSAKLQIPWPLNAIPLKASVRMSAPRPDRLPLETGAKVTAQGKLEWDNLYLGQTEVNGLYQGNYYQFYLPVHLRPNLAKFELQLEADKSFRPDNGDWRNLSLIIFSLRLEPNYAEFGWRGWLASFARPGLLAIITFCSWGIGRGLLAGRRRALIVEIGAGSLLLLSMGLWPQAAEPLYAAWAFILPIAWLLLALAELFRRRAEQLPGAFIYAATLFPLLPLAQFGLGRLDLYSLNPGSVLIGAHIGALCYAGASYISSSLTQPQGFERAFQRGMIAAAFISLAFSHFTVFETDPWQGADFRFYYESWLRQESGGPGLSILELTNMPAPLSPVFRLTLWPIARLFGTNSDLALLNWRFLNELLLVLCFWILMRAFGGERQGRKLTPAVLWLGFNFAPLTENLGFGQWEIWTLLGLSLLAYWIQLPRREGLAGLALALPSSLRLYPAILAGYLGWGKHWRSLVGFFGGWAGLIVISGWADSFEGWKVFLGRAFSLPSARLIADVSNQSLWSFWERLSLSSSANFRAALPGWVIWASFATILGLALLILDSFRHSSETQLKLGATLWFALLIPACLWLPQLGPGLIGILALLVALNQLEANQGISRWQLWVFGLAYGILAYGDHNAFVSDQIAGLARIGASYRALAALSLLVLILLILRKTKNLS